DTHQSTTDPDARLYKKATGSEAKLAYLGHLLMENRNGLIVDALVTAATGTAERDAALTMLGELPEGRRATVGGDANYDTRDFVRHTRELGITPHVTQYPETTHRGSAIEARTTRHAGSSATFHQPLHTVTNADAGGNCVKTIGFVGFTHQLHATWDSAVVAKAIEGGHNSPASILNEFQRGSDREVCDRRRTNRQPV